MNVKDKKFLENLISKYSKKELSKNILYPLIDDAFLTIDILKGIEVMLTGKITMLEITQQFEYEFAKYIGRVIFDFFKNFNNRTFFIICGNYNA